MTTLADIMTKDVYATDANASVAEAAAAMVKGRFGSAIVLSGGAVVGIFTERDVLRAAGAGGDLHQEGVRDWMTPDPVTARPDADTEEAVVTMLGQGFRHLPVVEGTHLVGIVSLRDLLSARIRGG